MTTRHLRYGLRQDGDGYSPGEVAALDEVIKGKVRGNKEICHTACLSLLTKRARNSCNLKLL